MCDCVDGFQGLDCTRPLTETVLKPSTDFVVAIVICILVLLGKLPFVLILEQRIPKAGIFTISFY